MSFSTKTVRQPEPAAATGTLISRRVSSSNHTWNLVLVGIVLALGVLLPFLLPAAELGVAMRILIFALMGVGWNMMSGFGGMFSFGHAAFFGIGAYTTAFLLVEVGLTPWIGMIVGMIVSAAAAVGISYLALRYQLRGAYYALSTFAFAEMLRLFVIGNESLNKTVGFTVPVMFGDNWSMFQFRAGSPIYFWIGTAMLVIVMLFCIWFLRSRAGRFAIATRDDELAAAAVGIPTLRYKLTLVAISAAITALAGALYLQFYMFIDPDLAFGATVSNNAIITAVVGGVGTLWGPVLGAVIVAPLSDLVTELLRHPPEWLSFLEGLDGLDILVYAVVLIAFVLLLPKGIVGTFLGRRKK